MTGDLINRLRIDATQLEHIRSLIAGTGRDEQALRVALVLVHEAIRTALAASTEAVVSVSGPRFDDTRWRSSGSARINAYDALVERVRERTLAIAPPGAHVAVVSRGDDRLLQLDGRVTGHFPQDATGRYAGFYPEHAGQAIGQLLELKSRGIEFAVFPATAFWWLEFYSELARWLAPALVWSCEDCAIYELARLGREQEGLG